MRTWIGGLGLTVLALAASPRGAGAADAPAEKPAVDTKVLLDRLKSRATEWMNARKSLVVQCWNCEGTGSVRQLSGGRVVRSTCSGCKGAGKRYSKELGRKVLYEMRSPAWRARPTAQDEAGQNFASWKLSDSALVAPTTWRWDHAELVDDTHGLVFAFEGEDPTAKSSRWILVTDAGRSSSWYLWTEEPDGAWPEPGTLADTKFGPIPKLRSLALEAAIEKVTAANRPAEKGESERVLRLVLAPPEKAPPEASSTDVVRRDAIAYVRGIWGAMPTDYATIQMTFMATWQDRFGEREQRPAWQVSMDWVTFSRIRWENLTDEQAFALFVVKQEKHDGWRIVRR